MMEFHAGIEGGVNIGGEKRCLWDGGVAAARGVVLARTSEQIFPKDVKDGQASCMKMPFHVLQN